MFFPFSTFLTTATSLFLWGKKNKDLAPKPLHMTITRPYTFFSTQEEKLRKQAAHKKRGGQKPEHFPKTPANSKRVCFNKVLVCGKKKNFSEHFTFTTISYQSLPFVIKAIDTDTSTLCLLLLTCLKVQLNKQLK